MEEHTVELSLKNDHRWQLVERILASRYFVKSERLRTFLVYLCRTALEGRTHEINEETIAAQVFGRGVSFDPAVDTLVRSHAFRLRQRLQQYFSSEEPDAQLTLEIPKGGYAPVFVENLCADSKTSKDCLEDRRIVTDHLIGDTDRFTHERLWSSRPDKLVVTIMFVSLLANVGLVIACGHICARRHPMEAPENGKTPHSV
jgi:hypothetical protein